MEGMLKHRCVLELWQSLVNRFCLSHEWGRQRELQLHSFISPRPTHKRCLRPHTEQQSTESERLRGQRAMSTVTTSPESEVPVHHSSMCPVLADDPYRFCVFPLKSEELWSFWTRAKASFWTPQEIDFKDDAAHFAQLSQGEQHFLKTILAFFASADGIVNENIVQNFCNEVQLVEAKCFYAGQVFMEAIHGETYSMLIDTLIQDPVERTSLFQAITAVPVVKSKAQWALHWLNQATQPFAHRLVAFACLEGIHFSASFCAIYHFKRRGIMNGLTSSNEFISRDEALHTEFAVALHRLLLHKASPATIAAIVQGAVQVEEEFVREALKTEILGMNAKAMIQYVQFVADRLLVDLDCPKLYNVSNPFPFMEMQSLEGKSSFFEVRPTAYSMAGVGVDTKNQVIRMDADF